MEDDLFGGLLFAEPAPPTPSPAPKLKTPARKAAQTQSETVAPTAQATEETDNPPAANGEPEGGTGLRRSGEEPVCDRAALPKEPAAPNEQKSREPPQEPLPAPTPTATPAPSDKSATPAQPGRAGNDAAPQKQPKPPHVPLGWPSALAGTASIAVLENAIAKNRLAHGLLLHGDDFTLLTQVAHALADRLLNTPESSAYYPPAQHPDCFALRPSGASRQVSADDTRELIGKTQVSGSVSPRKVAILYECDRMNLAAANIFLKTLEEPPANTTLLLLTTQPYALLPTVRSRVLHFRFPVGSNSLAQAAGLPAWLSDYQTWLAQLCEGVSKRGITDSIFSLYGLVARFDAILSAATAEAWESEKTALPEELDKDEQKAVEKRLANGIRQRLFAEIEQATRTFALPRLTHPELAETVTRTRRAHTAAISELEHSVGLLRLNLNHAAALENFLLHSMRLWARR